MYDVDPFIIKTLRELEERMTKEKLQSELAVIETNKHLEGEKRKTDFLARKKGKKA
jgi:hypothetical protein